MRYAVGLSEHPDSGVATGEVVGQILDRIGPSPDLAVLFLTGHHADAAHSVLRAVRHTLGARAVIGASAVAVLGHRQEIEGGPGISLWAGHTGPTPTLRLTDGVPLPDDLATGSAVALLTDPFTYDAATVLRSVPRGVTVVGGMASSASRPGGNRLLIDDDVHTDGAVAAVLPPDLLTRAIISQGCRPVGEPLIVTACAGNLIQELGGRPALERLQATAAAADPPERELLRQGLHIGLVVDEHLDTFGAGDFLIRAVMGADRSTGAIAVGDRPAIGTTVQFQVRDAAAATGDLDALCRPWQADAVLAFTCNGRGSHLFGRPGHDAEHLVDNLATTAVAGMFCAGEFGPVGGRHELHGFTASALLFGATDVA